MTPAASSITAERFEKKIQASTLPSITAATAGGVPDSLDGRIVSFSSERNKGNDDDFQS